MCVFYVLWLCFSNCMCCDDFISFSGPCCFPSRVSVHSHSPFPFAEAAWHFFLNDDWPVFLPKALHLIPDSHLCLVSEGNVVTAHKAKHHLLSLPWLPGTIAVGSCLLMLKASVSHQNNMLSSFREHISSPPVVPWSLFWLGLRDGGRGSVVGQKWNYQYGSSSLQRNLSTNFLPPPLS